MGFTPIERGSEPSLPNKKEEPPKEPTKEEIAKSLAVTEKRQKEEEKRIKEYETQMPKILDEYKDVITKNEDKDGNVTYGVKHEVIGMLDVYARLEYSGKGTFRANMNTLGVVDAKGEIEEFDGA